MIAKNLSIAPLSILTGIILIIGCSDITAKTVPNTPTESVVTATKSETKPQKDLGILLVANIPLLVWLILFKKMEPILLSLIKHLKHQVVVLTYL